MWAVGNDSLIWKGGGGTLVVGGGGVVWVQVKERTKIVLRRRHETRDTEKEWIHVSYRNTLLKLFFVVNLGNPPPFD